MQTFLPHSSFVVSAQVLDWRRLNKQITEALQILQSLEGGGGWSHHPAVRMWSGYEIALTEYGCVMYDEWMRRFEAGERGGKLTHKSGEELLDRLERCDIRRYELPPWWGDHRLHSTHRACLLAKDPKHYGQLGWTEEPTPRTADGWPYWWPGERE
jgi:hypothetical protein